MKLIFLFSHIPDPRLNKRISLLKVHNDVTLIYWNAESRQIWNHVHNDIETIEIKIPSNFGNPLSPRRLLSSVKFAWDAIRYLKHKRPEIIYAANLDMLFIATLYTLGEKNKPKIIYEIADVHRLLIDNQKNPLKKIVSVVLRYMDRILCRGISLQILTSEKFYSNYFSRFVPREKVIFMPNIPDLSVFQGYLPEKNSKFTVGFIGAVRYKEQMKMLIEAAKECDVNVLFAGASFDNEIEELCKSENHVVYYGRYNYNSDVAHLYGKVDCIYSVYDADQTNVRMALPNKFYESIYCELPIIVARDTYLSEQVVEMSVGVAVSHKDKRELVTTLKKLSSNPQYYQGFVEACRFHKDKLSLEVYNQKLLLSVTNLT